MQQQNALNLHKGPKQVPISRVNQNNNLNSNLNAAYNNQLNQEQATSYMQNNNNVPLYNAISDGHQIPLYENLLANSNQIPIQVPQTQNSAMSQLQPDPAQLNQI